MTRTPNIRVDQLKSKTTTIDSTLKGSTMMLTYLTRLTT